MRRWTSFAPIALLATGGCLASKSDIRLIQDELRATRAQLALDDTSMLRANESRRSQIAQLSASIDRMNDSLRVAAARLASFQAATTGEFDAMGKQMVRVQALLDQSTRNLQNAQAQLEALKEQGGVPSEPAAAAPSSDTARLAPSGPGPSTLFLSAKDQLDTRAYGLARAGFERLLSTYPTSEQAPRAQLYIGEAYKAEGNTAAADSVYLLVASKYPRSSAAATGLYRHGKTLWDANKKGDARPYLNRVIREFPNSDEARLAKDLLGGRE